MWLTITNFFGNFFGNAKNILIAVGSLLVLGYVGKLKYKAHRAESKLASIENKIAKTNVVIAKTKAKAKAKAVKAETTAEIKVLRELKKEAEKVEKEMVKIEEEIETRLQDPGTKISPTRRRRGGKIKLEI